MAKKKKDLVAIIKANPGCVAIIDNDEWWLYAEHPHKIDEEKEPVKYKSNQLAESGDDFKPLGDGGYGSGNCYGGDILQALAIIVGVKIESV